ncbi:GmrSD restriction endonuclease domain-containing protein [Corynebacterium guangdongense]|uniref:GmrSD restriction endonucleases N-terminal domain-containing protein n=1 Tax=Corynebacterium guangdongense TaxID=1783348 RepID=A0ABU1ZW64_9CORY|nr:DUF262 domain-containing protein [Corynebacterium guangdongense]MDR7329183.1 hypothetical protein [Corynebacterium guangdongense]WJZ17749.1 hypothetical protein CGUA_05840 [Corynebacterium guangdongense]
MAFTTPSYSLPDLFSRINHGELQLPDFQRAYLWNSDRIRSLLVTVLRGYPIGSLLALDTRNADMRFKPRPISGAPETGQNPGLLLLDGQQRVTSLYHCFQGGGHVDTVDFRNKKITRRFYVDVSRAVQKEVLPQEAVFAVDENGVVSSHFGPRVDGSLSDREVAVAARVIPVDALLTSEGSSMLFDMAAQATPEEMEEIKLFNARVATPLNAYDVPMIRLARETAQAGVGSIFAQANAVGLQMDVFDLLTAVFGIEDPDFDLDADWARTESILRQYPALDEIDKTSFLTAVSLLVTAPGGHAVGQREDIINLKLADYQSVVSRLRAGFRAAAEFLAQRCILSVEQVPYSAQIVPLAVILALLDESPESLGAERATDRLNRWFWSGVFGELYGSAAVIIRAGRDVDEVVPWILREDAPEPQTLHDATFAESRFFSIDEHSGVWHGIYALLMARGARDWRTGRVFDRWTYSDLDPSFERVFPRQWCADNGVEQVLADSVLNRTPMGKRTEVVLDGFDPSRYLTRVRSKSLMEDDEFDSVIASHEITPELLFRADARGFFEDRLQRMIGMVEHAMAKPVLRDVEGSDYTSGVEGPGAFAR